MIRRAPALATLLAAVILPSAAALAQDDYEELPQVLERSVYLQLSGIGAFQTFGSTVGNDSGGLNFRVGFRASQWWSVEAAFEWVAGMAPDGNTSGGDWTTTFTTRIYPLSDRIMKGRLQPHFLIGLGATSYKRNVLGVGCIGDSPPCQSHRVFGFSSRWGGGADFYVTDEIAVTVDATYVWVTGTPVKDLSYVSLGFGVMYRFY